MNINYMKLHCRFVCETREYRQFYWQSDADKFTEQQNKLGRHVLSAIDWISC